MTDKNLTAEYFRRVNRLLYLFGVTNLSDDSVGISHCILFIFRHATRMISVSLYLFVGLELLGLFTQTNLNEKQKTDRLVFGFSHPVLITYYVTIDYHKGVIKQVLHTLTVDLKKVYIDNNVERKTIRKSKLFSAAYLCSFSSALISYGFDGLMQVLRGDGTFTTVMTAWPDVRDRSVSANAVRIISYLIWWLFMLRVSSVYVLVISLTICLSHQYENMQNYFYELIDIFKAEGLDRTEMEKKYVRSLKIGIKLHSDTLWCTKQIQSTCAIVFSGQIFVNIYVICLLMLQMVVNPAGILLRNTEARFRDHFSFGIWMMNSERTLVNALATLTTGVTMLVSTGFFMWNAGDITVEAARLSTAMYSSGWENCQRESLTRVKRLLVIAMAQSQRAVVLRSFNIIELSYQSYVSIVKSSYSVFSILY